MKNFYFKKLFLFIVLLSIGGSAYHHFQKEIKSAPNDGDFAIYMNALDACEQATNLMINYEMGMPLAQVSWDGPLPSEGWYILYGYENSIDLNWFMSDPDNYEQPEIRREKVYSSPHHIYTYTLHPGMYDLYIIADCGDGNLILSDKITFEAGERGHEEIGACEGPENFNMTQLDPRTMNLTWDAQEGELYQIAWLPFGMEMNDDFYHNPQAGSVIVSGSPYVLEFYPPGAEEARSVFIRKFCGDNRFSEWVMPKCYPPSDLESTVNDETVVLSWTPAATEFAWNIVYGPHGFDPNSHGEGIFWINAYDDPTFTIQLNTLQQGITYDFYVRVQCSGENFSEWAGPGSFETVFVPCDPVEDIITNHITDKTVDIYWTPMSGESQWEVMYSVAPFDLGQAYSQSVNNDSKTILTGLLSSTTYEAIIVSTCPSGETTQSEIFSFTTIEDDDPYCIPYFLTGCNYSYIDHLILDGENDTRIYDLNTGCTDSNYNNQTHQVIDLAPGNEYFTRTYHGNFPISGHRLAIWIDLNDDGIYDDESERMGDGALTSSDFTNIKFTIPSDANPGLHRMRVMLAFNAYAYQLTPCNDGESISTNGEVHEYTVNILPVTDCNVVDAGTTIDNFKVCPGDVFRIETIGASEPAHGLERKWQSSPAGQNNWTDLDYSALPTTTLYNGIQEATDFRYVVTCTESGETTTSDVLSVTMSTDCYCYQGSECGGPGGLQINRVRLEGETVTIDNSSGCGGDGYSDYTLEFPSDLKRKESYQLYVTANNAMLSSDKIRAWIDYNGNNVFENHEIILDFPEVPDYTVNSTFTVPENVYAGIYRMRIRIGWFMSPNLTGCNLIGWGETEDYLVEILPNEVPENCPLPSDINITTSTNPTTADVTWTPGGIETKWEVVYGFEGFDPETATPILVNNSPNLQLNNLEPSKNYDVYVRSLCQGGEISDWTEPKKFTTGELKVKDSNFEEFAYFPVPTDNKLNLKSKVEIENVVIFDPTGKVAAEFTPLSKNAELNISQLSSGVYFMKVTLNGSTKIFKILKK